MFLVLGVCFCTSFKTCWSFNKNLRAINNTKLIVPGYVSLNIYLRHVVPKDVSIWPFDQKFHTFIHNINTFMKHPCNSTNAYILPIDMQCLEIVG